MTRGIYSNHRENQREWILSVVQDLFVEKGIDKVTIADITKAARLTRATLYNYFSSKEQMAHEIFKIIANGWVERNLAEVWNVPGNGFERVERFVLSHFEHLTENLQEARFVAEFNHLYAKEWSVEVIQQLLFETLEEDRTHLFESIQQGQIEGSIRSDISPELLLAVIFNFSSGLADRLGQFGSKLEAEYSISTSTIFERVCRVFLDGLKA